MSQLGKALLPQPIEAQLELDGEKTDAVWNLSAYKGQSSSPKICQTFQVGECKVTTTLFTLVSHLDHHPIPRASHARLI
jgi:hypothetical protein